MDYNISSILYYPSIEFQSPDWLKTSLLLWDKVYRIVPDNYIPQDAYPVKQAESAGIVCPIRLESGDFQSISSEFIRWVSSIRFKPAGLDGIRTDRLHKDKIDSRLYPFLEKLATNLDYEGFLQVPEALARGYMLYLAKAVAGRRMLATATDSRDVWAVSPYFTERANFDSNVITTETEGYYSALIFQRLLPHLPMVDMKEIITFVEKRRDERSNLRVTINEFAAMLGKCQSSEHARELVNTFAARLLKAKEDFRKSMDFANPDDQHSLMTVGLPIAATLFGALVSLGTGVVDPFSLASIGGSVFVGAVAAYKNYGIVMGKERKASSVAYLVDIDQSLGTKVPRYERFFEEFMND